MKTSKSSFRLAGDIALISIHPEHVAKILSGDKNFEFRRTWSRRDVRTLVVYSTAPDKRLAAVVEVVDVIRGSKTQLWSRTSQSGPGLTRRTLFDYLEGKTEGVALALGRRLSLGDDANPAKVFRAPFNAPQSFRFLTESETALLSTWMER
jgi:predicted transcriptional regulator